MPSHVEALRYGDRCWSKVLVDWEQWRSDGLTAHENWWPAAVPRVLRGAGRDARPGSRQFDVSYKDSRADLKPVSSVGGRWKLDTVT